MLESFKRAVNNPTHDRVAAHSVPRPVLTIDVPSPTSGASRVPITKVKKHAPVPSASRGSGVQGRKTVFVVGTKTPQELAKDFGRVSKTSASGRNLSLDLSEEEMMAPPQQVVHKSVELIPSRKRKDSPIATVRTLDSYREPFLPAKEVGAPVEEDILDQAKRLKLTPRAVAKAMGLEEAIDLANESKTKKKAAPRSKTVRGRLERRLKTIDTRHRRYVKATADVKDHAPLVRVSGKNAAATAAIPEGSVYHRDSSSQKLTQQEGDYRDNVEVEQELKDERQRMATENLSADDVVAEVEVMAVIQLPGIPVIDEPITNNRNGSIAPTRAPVTTATTVQVRMASLESEALRVAPEGIWCKKHNIMADIRGCAPCRLTEQERQIQILVQS